MADATGWRIVHRSATASTNDDARALRAAGAGPRTAVVADRQSAGRGRAGRAFASPAGGLYASLLIAPPPDCPAAALVACVAVAAAEALDGIGVPDVAIKWPNDIWITRRKVAGILLEASDGEACVVAGVGMNLRTVPDDLPPDVAQHTTAVARHVPHLASRAPVLTAMLASIDTWIEALHATGTAPLDAAWRARLALLGEPVELGYRGASIQGVLEDVSLARGLCIRSGAGDATWYDAAFAHDLRPA